MHRLIIFFALMPLFAMAQTAPQANALVVPTSDSTEITMLPYRLVDGDTVPYMTYSEFEIAHKTQETRRLEYRVKKTYEYAQIAAAILEKINYDLDTLESGRQRRLYLKEAQEVVKVEFEDELKNLSVGSGRVLMQMIYRETGETTYELVKELRGRSTAWFYQGFAKLYGGDMKVEYDPEGEDAQMEALIQRIEAGELKPTPREAKTKAGEVALEERRDRQRRERRRRKKVPKFDVEDVVSQ